MNVCVKAGVFCFTYYVLDFVCTEDGERATTGRPYTEKADRSYKLSVFWNDSGIISVHRFHLDFVGATSVSRVTL